MKNMEIKKLEPIYEFSVTAYQGETHFIALTESQAIELRDALIEALVDTNK